MLLVSGSLQSHHGLLPVSFLIIFPFCGLVSTILPFIGIPVILGCCCSVMSKPVTSCIVARQASQSFTISWSLLKLMSIESMMPSNHLILCHPLLLLPSIFPRIRLFSSELALHIRWPEYWNFSFSLSPSNEYSTLISLRIDWLESPCSPRDSQESSLTPQFNIR